MEECSALSWSSMDTESCTRLQVTTLPWNFRTGLQLPLPARPGPRCTEDNSSAREDRLQTSHRFLSVHGSCLGFASQTTGLLRGRRLLYRTSDNHHQLPRLSCQTYSTERSTSLNKVEYHWGSRTIHCSIPSTSCKLQATKALQNQASEKLLSLHSTHLRQSISYTNTHLFVPCNHMLYFFATRLVSWNHAALKWFSVPLTTELQKSDSKKN